MAITWEQFLALILKLLSGGCHTISLIRITATSPKGQWVNTLRPRQNGHHFPDDIFKWILLNENVWITIKISLKFVPKGLMNNIPALVQIMTWRRPGDKPLSEPVMFNLLTYICVTWPQWVNWCIVPWGIATAIFSIFNFILLTHWGRDKMAIFQTTFSNAFSSTKMCEFRLTFHQSLFLRVPLTISHVPGNKPLSDPMMFSLLMHICVDLPQWDIW